MSETFRNSIYFRRKIKRFNKLKLKLLFLVFSVLFLPQGVLILALIGIILSYLKKVLDGFSY